MIDKRWNNQLHQDIHAAGYFLNPKYQYANDVVNDDEVLNGFHRVVNRMVNDNETRLNINREAKRFRLKTSAFGSNQFQSAVNRCLPAEWWSIYARENAPNFTRLAVRILSQTVSSSNCEKNWTTFSLIHTRPRNRLTIARLEKLVFVHYNMRLRVRNVERLGNNQNVIYLDEIFHDQDPLTAWTRKREAPLLDGRENEWLDDNLDIDPQDTAANVRRPEKRKKTPNVPSRQVDSDKDDSTDSGGNGATLATGVYQSHEYENSGDQSHEYSGDWSSDHQPREHRMDDVYAGGSSYHDVPTPSDNYNNTYDSSFTSYYPYNTPEAEQHSTFDGLMTNFFNNTYINLYYPHNQQPYRDDSDNYEPF
ncbi:Uncharacterized protein M6B38_236825 [Iris pallida]|uniref:HAT C-terminal dimerisation domain-containing protein n=1 Tax=Iris pallida TaxID=29817 RepID=A0AAX6DMC9_IRIPA|nr:Uncharacterized protein M6B38_236825 [Iris pallida]